MNRDINRLLKSALAPSVVPDERLNRQLLEKAKESSVMGEKNREFSRKKKPEKRFKSPAVAAGLTVCVLAAGSLTAVAAYRYLSPAQIVTEMGNEKLAEAFSGEGAVLIDESQVTGGYRVTLMGMVTGEGLNLYFGDADNAFGADRTYAVIAIEREDGAPMPEQTAEDFRIFPVSPLIAGQNPMVVNSASLNLGATGIVRDGVQYELVDCDSLELYGAHGVYLSVVENFGDITQSFVMDASDGSFSVKPEVTEMAALFRLPLDPEKADYEAAQERLEQIKEEFEHPAQQSAEAPDAEGSLIWQAASDREGISPELAEFLAKVTTENYQSYLAPDESTRITLTPDAEGYVSYDRGEEGGGTLWLGTPDTWREEELERETMVTSSMGSTLESLSAEMLTLHADGTVTLVIYRPIL